MTQPAYIVLRETADNTWQLVAEVPRRPGVPARRSRAEAIEEALGHPRPENTRFAVLPRSEWRLALDS